MNGTVATVFIVYFVAVFAVGLLAGRRTKGTTESFYLGDRGISGPLTALTYLASMVSAGALIGWTSLSMLWGPFFIWVAVFFTLAIFLTWYLLGPRVMVLAKRVGAVTIPDFMHARFDGKSPRLLSSLILLVFLVPLLAANYFAAGLLIERLTPFSYTSGVWVFGALVFLYVAFGGFRAVVWTDAIQGLMLAIGASILLAVAVYEVGFGGLGGSLSESNPTGMVSWPTGIEPGSSYFISFIMLNFFGAFGAPYFIVRFFSVRNARSLRSGFVLVMSLVAIMEIVVVLIGLYARALFPQLTEDPDSTFLVMAEELLPLFVSTIVLAALAAAMMSTIDSILLVLASTVENDIMTKTFNVSLSNHQRVLVARGTTLVIGVLSIIYALNPPELLAFLLYPAFGVLGLVFGLLFVGAVYWPRFNKPGALTVMIVAPVSFIVWNQLGNPLGLYHIQVALLCTVPAMLAVTYLTPPPPARVIEQFFPSRHSGEPARVESTDAQ
ncbi:sodium:solute symporter family transporter [Modestobacter lapidis]|nr:sodium/solute symporter [Modestobacter lapidis]